MSRKNRLLMSSEDYLEAILHLSEFCVMVKSTDVAKYLGVSKASVSKAMHILTENEYVEHKHYGQIMLTEKGKKLAEMVMLKHNVLKCFLIECLGVNEETADEEACVIEHTISQTTLTKLIDFLQKQLNEKIVNEYINLEHIKGKK